MLTDPPVKVREAERQRSLCFFRLISRQCEVRGEGSQGWCGVHSDSSDKSLITAGLVRGWGGMFHCRQLLRVKWVVVLGNSASTLMSCVRREKSPVRHHCCVWHTESNVCSVTTGNWTWHQGWSVETGQNAGGVQTSDRCPRPVL